MSDKIRTSILVEKDAWERFKKIAKYNDSDSSKEIRKMMKKYISDNADLTLKMD
jgi:rubrerythrin